MADRAYSHPSTRAALRARGIAFTSPERADQIARRKAKGSAGGRPRPLVVRPGPGSRAVHSYSLLAPGGVGVLSFNLRDRARQPRGAELVARSAAR